MSNKVFVFLVVVLSILIILALVAFVGSLMKYNGLLEEANTGENVTTVEDSAFETEENEINEIVTEVKNESLYLLPSDTREIILNDIKDMDKDELNRAYNEIFARHGHDFKTKSLKDYFLTQSWYKPVEGKTVTPAELSDMENKNKDIIMNRIKELDK